MFPAARHVPREPAAAYWNYSGQSPQRWTVPCVKRNVVGVVNAISCANMALAGIVSRIPPDEVIDAMAEVGNSMSADLRETARGGLAATPTGKRIAAERAE